MKQLLIASLAVFFCGCASLNGTSYEEIKTGMYRDGGTVWVELKKEGNERIELLCIDRQTGSETQLELFMGARHPKDDGAMIATEKERVKWIELLKKEIPQDSQEHSRFIEVLNDHIQHKETEPGEVVNASSTAGLSENHLHD